jgi:hypothetical protein
VVLPDTKADKLQEEKRLLVGLTNSHFEKVQSVLAALESDFLDSISPLQQNLAGVRARYMETLDSSQPKFCHLTSRTWLEVQALKKALYEIVASWYSSIEAAVKEPEDRLPADAKVRSL